jgi:hypothetical protein
MRRKRDRQQPLDLSELQANYRAACDAEDYDRQVEILEAMTASYPDISWPWYDLGLRMKWRRDWPASRAANLRALALLDVTANEPAAWNLGIAATALGDWPTARRAWSAFGIQIPDGPDGPDGPIDDYFGMTPIRLNPDPRFAEPLFTLNGIRHGTEVLWAWRLCPARARIMSVPLPDSGHRHGDVVLHDGDPVGERQGDGASWPVFNEIAVLEHGRHATLSTIIDDASSDDLEELQDLFTERGYMAEPWSRNVRLLCKACSEGAADAAHDHPPGVPPPQHHSVTLGLAAPTDEAEALLDEWLGPRGLRRGPVEGTEPTRGREGIA